jgi:hypothetical protein
MRANQNSNNNGHRRMRGRHGNNNNNRKGPNPLTRSYESNGPDIKIRGSAQHIADKYAQLGRDAQVSSDPVAAESFFQHAEHYFRLIAEAQIQMYGEVQRPVDMTEGDEALEASGQERSSFEPRAARQNSEEDYGSQPQPVSFMPRQDRQPDMPQERESGRFQRSRDRFQGQGHNDERSDRQGRYDQQERQNRQDRQERFHARDSDPRQRQERYERSRSSRYDPGEQAQDRQQDRQQDRPQMQDRFDSRFESKNLEPRAPQNRDRQEWVPRFDLPDRGDRPDRPARASRFEAPHFEPSRSSRRPVPVQNIEEDQRLPAFLTNPVRGSTVDAADSGSPETLQVASEPVSRPKRGRRKVMQVEPEGLDLSLPKAPAAE